MLLVKPEVLLYKIPPRTTNRGYKVSSTRPWVLCVVPLGIGDGRWGCRAGSVTNGPNEKRFSFESSIFTDFCRSRRAIGTFNAPCGAVEYAS